MHIVTRSCVILFWMHTLTFVKSQECTRREFLNGPLFDSNFDITGLEDRYPGGRQVRVGCNIGYSGFFKLLCVEGKWQSKGTTCKPKSCGHPGDTPFADFRLEIGEDFVFGSQVIYTCQRGYQMMSRFASRRCLAEGWDGMVPVCEPKKCPAMEVNDNVQVMGDPWEANSGNVLRFSCKYSSEVLIGLQVIFCNDMGEWSGEAPKCEAIKCLVPKIENGNLLGDTQDYKEHDILHFECAPGFMQTEKIPSKCTKIGMRAEWAPNPSCKLIKCDLALVPGSEYEPALNVFTPGATVRVTCGESHWVVDRLKTSAVVSCKNDGEWSHYPICQEVLCSDPQDLNLHWNNYFPRQSRLGEVVHYGCKRKYKSTDGSNQARCTREGWKPNPLCQAITCPRLEIQNADIVKPKDIYYESQNAKYVCKDGYEGELRLTCTIDGWWGDTRCTEKLCERLDIDQAYIISDERSGPYPHNTKVQYACKEDKRHFNIVCEKGRWTGIKSCSGCPEPEVPNGFIALPHNDTLYYTCDEGYKLASGSWWAEAKCHGSVWSGLHPCIVNSTCAQVPVIPHGQVNFNKSSYAEGESLQIDCDEGYRAEDLTCRDGQWKILNTTICAPVAIHCSPPPQVKNAVVLSSYQREFVSGSNVTYQCQDSYGMDGNATISCNNGSWEIPNTTCARLESAM